MEERIGDVDKIRNDSPPMSDAYRAKRSLNAEFDIKAQTKDVAAAIQLSANGIPDTIAQKQAATGCTARITAIYGEISSQEHTTPPEAIRYSKMKK